MKTTRRYPGPVLLALLVALAAAPDAAMAMRIKDLCEVQGARGNDLIGTGIVVGLAGTGDKAQLAVTAQQRLLERLDVKVESLDALKPDNCAIVMVTAVLPAFAKEGTRIDVSVNSLGDCESLEGGALLEAHLRPLGGDDTVYAVAQGNISVGGFNAAGGGANVRKNHVTAGRIPMGAYIEREVPSTITDGQRIVLLLKRPDFTTAYRIQEAIADDLGPGCAAAFGAGAVRVTIPETGRGDLISFIAQIQEIQVETDTPSRVVVNERTGTIVVSGDVRIKPCQVAHGNLTIKVTQDLMVSQPPPFSLGVTTETEVTQVRPEEEEAYLMPVEGASAADVAAALNKLKVTPRDMISIFQALREAGALEVDLEVM